MIRIMTKRIIVAWMLTFCLATLAQAQSFTLTFAKEMPTFEGVSTEDFAAKVGESVSCVPEEEALPVTVGFYVTKDGKLLKPRVLRSAGEKVDKEVLRAVSETEGVWKPALDQDGQPIDWFVTVNIQPSKNE